MDKKNMTPAMVPIVPQPVWGSLRNAEDDSLTEPEWWFFYQGQMYPLRPCFESTTAIPVSDFISMSLSSTYDDPRVLFGAGRITMKVLNAHSVSLGEIYPTMTTGQEVATLQVHEIVPRDPPDGYKDIVFTRVEDVPERPISAPELLPVVRKQQLTVTDAKTGVVMRK